MGAGGHGVAAHERADADHGVAAARAEYAALGDVLVRSREARFRREHAAGEPGATPRAAAALEAAHQLRGTLAAHLRQFADATAQTEAERSPYGSGGDPAAAPPRRRTVSTPSQPQINRG
jgi:hypothetical protein